MGNAALPAILLRRADQFACRSGAIGRAQLTGRSGIAPLQTADAETSTGWFVPVLAGRD
jgi:hypothetical protein